MIYAQLKFTPMTKVAVPCNEALIKPAMCEMAVGTAVGASITSEMRKTIKGIRQSLDTEIIAQEFILTTTTSEHPLMEPYSALRIGPHL